MITKTFVLENKDKWEKHREEINELDNITLRDLIIEEPDIISIIDLDKLDGWDIYNVLERQPGLIKDLKPYLHKLDGWEISIILLHYPEFIKYFKPYLYKLIGGHIYYVLMNHPKLIEEFKLHLNRLDKRYIPDILEERPELSLFFKYVGTEHEDVAYYYTYPSEISKLDKEEKQEVSKKLVELIREEKK